MDKLHNEHTDNLFRAILTLESVEECYKFFEDACTINEILAISQRFEVAKMLSEGHVYSDVCKETGASTATISRVNKCRHYGADGYRIALDRMKEK